MRYGDDAGWQAERTLPRAAVHCGARASQRQGRRQVTGTYRNIIADVDTDVNLDFDLDIVEQQSQDSQADLVGLVRAVTMPSSSEEDEPVAQASRSGRRAKKSRSTGRA